MDAVHHIFDDIDWPGNHSRRPKFTSYGSQAEMRDQMKNASKNLAEEYLRLGGRRLAVIDDNLGSSRDWKGDPPEAARFWKEQIACLSDREKRDVQTFLPSINDERDEPASK